MAEARREPPILLLAVVGFLLVSGLRPEADRLTWLLETAPVMIGVPVLVATYARFPLTPLLYRLLALHAVILIVGGHYTYAQVPLFDWLQTQLGLARNHYDRIGHLAQGFVPAILAREILIRRSPLRPGGWLMLTVTSICLAFSAFYELIEWWTALISRDAGEAFLGTQGDQWDTQWDMFLALIGALASQLGLRRVHDRQLAPYVGSASGPASGRGAAA
jgi:putative membrane protein